VEALKAAARQRLAEGQCAFDLGLDATGIGGGPLEIVSLRAGHPWEALCRAYHALGFDRALDGDEVFRDLVLARIIEPTCHGHITQQVPARGPIRVRRQRSSHG
jgi:hypothetical protein